MEKAGCCRVTPGGGGGGGRPEVTARPTMFMSFLAAGSSISTGLVWTESSEGTKPRLSIKLTRREMKNGSHSSATVINTGFNYTVSACHGIVESIYAQSTDLHVSHLGGIGPQSTEQQFLIILL